jgi:hypothetical protein
MCRDDKRALLASWASDAHAVPGLPSMRQLEDGSPIEVDEILRPLKALDAVHDATLTQTTMLLRMPPQRRSRPSLRNWTRIMRHRRRNDDDDPPPSPVLAVILPTALA